MSVAEALERLAALATPGPWETKMCNCGSYTCNRTGFTNGTFYQGNGFEPDDAALVDALVNHLPTIIEALKALERAEGEGGVK